MKFSQIDVELVEFAVYDRKDVRIWRVREADNRGVRIGQRVLQITKVNRQRRTTLADGQNVGCIVERQSRVDDRRIEG